MWIESIYSQFIVVVTGGRISVVQSLLEELPGQFLSYMRCRDIKPLNFHAAQPSAPQY
jgi:hypothetical protein